MIDVTGIDKVAFAKAVYELSVPAGFGFLHARHGELADEDAQAIANNPEGFHMDYVHGRGCKMYLREKAGGRLVAPDTWYDHTDSQYDELLGRFGIKRTANRPHRTACDCSSCNPHSRSRSEQWEKDEAAPRN